MPNLQFTSLCVSLVVATALTAPPAAAATADLPFRATFAGSAAMPAPAAIVFTGTGSGTLVGRITTDGRVQPTGIDEQRCAGGIANVNIEIVTAANGDTLTVTSADVSCPIGPGQYHGSGAWWVSGGTGRFARASGSGKLDGYADFAAGTFDITLTGSLLLATGSSG